MDELLQQAEEWEAQKTANRTGTPVMNQTQITAQRQEIERLMAEDPTFNNYELIFADCTNNMAFGNGTMSDFQCMSAFQEAKDKYCRLEAYHQTKCEYITFTSDTYNTFANLVG
jgi:hypothetical protein